MAAISVLVPATGSPLPLLRSLDAQTLAATEFEVVVAAPAPADEALQRLARCRANIVLAPGADIAVAVEVAVGDWTVVVDPDLRLAPRALELLLDRATGSGADAVIGRVASAGDSGCASLPDDGEAVEDDRRERPGRLVLRQAGAPATTIATVDGLACATRDHVSPPATHDPVAATASWSNGILHITAETAGLDTVDRAWLVLTDGTTELAVPADTTAATVTAEVDPRVALCGRALDPGAWRLGLRVLAGGAETTVPMALRATLPAVVGGTPVVLRDDRLHVGATSIPLIGRAGSADTSVTETAGGALGVLAYPRLHVAGDCVLDARIRLDGFALPARLVCQEGRARLEAYLGALAGESVVRVAVGGGPFAATGLRLVVDGVGRMAFEPIPPKTPAPPPLAQRLRRRLPAPVEPVVGRIARIPVARLAYRRLIGR